MESYLEVPAFAVDRYNSYRSDSVKAAMRTQETWVEYLSTQLLRWGAITDTFGHCLLRIPLFVCVGTELRRRGGPIVELFTVSGCCTRPSERPPPWS